MKINCDDLEEMSYKEVKGALKLVNHLKKYDYGECNLSMIWFILNLEERLKERKNELE